MPTNHTAQGGIYAVRHVASGKLYIGSAVDILKRWGEHRYHLDRGTHHSRYLQRAWRKHGPDAFVWEILSTAEDRDGPVSSNGTGNWNRPHCLISGGLGLAARQP
jgi:hypothetical protein